MIIFTVVILENDTYMTIFAVLTGFEVVSHVSGANCCKYQVSKNVSGVVCCSIKMVSCGRVCLYACSLYVLYHGYA